MARPRWFENSTPIVSFDRLEFHANDVLVVPEVYGRTLTDLPADVRVLVFNQGAYITFDGLDYAKTSPGAPYRGVRGLEGIMTVSHDSADLLSLSYPDVPVDIVRPVVDSSLFHPGDSVREQTIAFMPSRRAGEINQIMHILRARGINWTFSPMEGLTEREVAQRLRRSRLFLSMSDRDGFGLPPAEAMACGCYVVGYPGGGGSEFFDPSYCSPVASTAELVRAIETAISTPEEELAQAGERASHAIRSHYDVQGLADDLSKVFARILGAV
ncbi:glycosyltransferase family 1 protein [Microbacterium protaetiae]|uniref:Glycosyltransferase family 1 protein n=1 Tax=Microbacterium protaetiae TaxID=2509458 RepID=A0A4P6ED06_9MICO|nr:glycosyltransferase [Microbacterium protaetiae]QAY59974.1 glycosyltransferase family 1 protein [Microbacterium protaetiae]